MTDQDLNWLAAQQPQRIGANPTARQRALLELVQHTTSRPAARRWQLRVTPHIRRSQLGIALSAGAAAAALVVAAVSTVSGGGGSAGLSHRSAGAQTAVVSVRHTHPSGSPLLRLADYVNGFSTATGDATLVARTTASGNGQSVTVYDLYADNGEYFFSRTQSGMAAQVSANNNQADGLFAREIAAAKLAASGSVQAGAQALADAADPSKVVSPNQPPVNQALVNEKMAGQKHWWGPGNYQTGSQYANYVWENAQDALVAGAGDPQVRAGVLEILATLPDVTVTQGTNGNQATLTLTAGVAELGSGYTEQLTINADNGVPIEFRGGVTNAATPIVVTYGVSRVSYPQLRPSTASGTSSGGAATATTTTPASS